MSLNIYVPLYSCILKRPSFLVVDRCKDSFDQFFLLAGCFLKILLANAYKSVSNIKML